MSSLCLVLLQHGVAMYWVMYIISLLLHVISPSACILLPLAVVFVYISSFGVSLLKAFHTKAAVCPLICLECWSYNGMCI